MVLSRFPCAQSQAVPAVGGVRFVVRDLFDTSDTAHESIPLLEQPSLNELEATLLAQFLKV